MSDRMTIRQLERLADLLEMWGRDSFRPDQSDRLRRNVERRIDERRKATGHVNRRPNRPDRDSSREARYDQ